MKRNLTHLLFGLALTLGLQAQQLPYLSDDAQISVITCSAGTELYYAFGHSAFRVQDTKIGLDVVYNYGTFDFDKPNFYWNFTKGKLIYSLSRRRFEDFLYAYQLEKRWVKEQLLDLDQNEVNQLFKFFETNYRPENRDYLYDPLFNNCSNITSTILKENFGDNIVFKEDHLREKHTFRELVRQFIPINSWGSFGIELAFGGITDRTATTVEHMFLPYYAKSQLEHTTKNGKPLVTRERTILNYPESAKRGLFTLSPLFWFILLLGFVLVITYLDWIYGSRYKWLDFSLFLISGLIGMGILLLWLATDHTVTKWNFNFLWLLPSNAVVAFYLPSEGQRPKWLDTYLKAALIAMVVILLIWVLGLQVFSPLNLLLMAVLAARYLFLLKR